MRYTRLFSVLGLLCSILLTAQAQTFRDASALLHSDGPDGRVLGASAIDVNGDGLIDIYQNHRLYVNQGAAGFMDMLPATGLDEGEIAFGAIFGDYTNDGAVDVFFEDLTPPSNLFRGLGGGAFVQTNVEAGLDVGDVAVQGSLWLDYDNDGRLDLFIGGDGDQDLLFRNVDLERFEDQSDLVALPTPRQNYGAAAADVDRDGDLDIYIGACSTLPARSINVLWLNQGGAGFVEADAGVEDESDTWGVVWLDYDNDGWMDLYVVNSPPNTSDGRSGLNRLYQNDQLGGFVDRATTAGVAGNDDDYGYTAAAADFDNDGWIDLYVVNMRNGTPRLYRNNGDGTFSDIFEETGIPNVRSDAVAVADFDNDGGIDLFLGTDDGGHLLMNEGGANHWLKVSTEGVASNRLGIGARVEVYVDGSVQVREITAGEGMTSQHHNFTAHVGLGAEAQADSVVIRWPSRTVDRLVNVTADQHITVVEGQSMEPTATDGGPVVEERIRVWQYPNPFAERATIGVALPAAGRVTVTIHDVLGREVVTLAKAFLPAGVRVWTWEAQDERGHAMAPGVYVVRVEQESTVQARTFIHVR